MKVGEEAARVTKQLNDVQIHNVQQIGHYFWVVCQIVI